MLSAGAGVVLFTRMGFDPVSVLHTFGYITPFNLGCIIGPIILPSQTSDILSLRTCRRCCAKCASWCSQWRTGAVSTALPSCDSSWGRHSRRLPSSSWATKATWFAPARLPSKVKRRPRLSSVLSSVLICSVQLGDQHMLTQVKLFQSGNFNQECNYI